VKSIIIFCFLVNIIYADILTIHKKIVPIILLQSKQIITKNDKILNLALVVNQDEEIKAYEFKDILATKIKNFNLKIHIFYESDIKKNIFLLNNSDGIYCFNLSNDTYNLIKNYAINYKKITFSYSKIGLSKGLMFFVDFTTRIIIYANKQSIKSSDIDFNTKFLRIITIYDN
jgi:hypothetical protein